MKKLIFLVAFTFSLLSSANAQKFTIKVSPSKSMYQSDNYATIRDNRYTNNRNNISVEGSVEFSKKGGVKFKINNTQEKPDLYLHPLSRKQLENEKMEINKAK